MKLATRVINEVLNSSTIYINKRIPPQISEMDYYHVIGSRSVSRVIIPTKGDKYRPIEVTTKSELGGAQTPIFGPEGKIDFFLKGEFIKHMNGILKQRLKDRGHDDETVERVLSGKGAFAVKIKKDHGWMTKEKYYLWLINEGVLDIVIKQVFPELQNVDVEAEIIKHGNIQLIGFDEKKHKKLIDIIDQADDLLKASGFGKLVHGKVYLVPKKTAGRQTVLADYLKKDDSMRIFDIGVKGTDPVRTVIHELGHRHYYKNISTQARSDIMKEFYKKMQELKTTVKAQVIYKVGDKVRSEKYGEVEYMGYRSKYAGGIGNGKYSHQFRLFDKQGNPTSKYLSFDSVEKAAVYFNATMEAGGGGELSSNNPWVPTTYSMTSDVEWFAEIFSFSVQDKNKEILAWIKGLS